MLEIAGIFQNNMVLQCKKRLFVWGTTEKQSKVTIEIQEKERCILFLCDYGVQSDQAARVARRKGYHQAYSIGGEKLKLY